MTAVDLSTRRGTGASTAPGSVPARRGLDRRVAPFVRCPASSRSVIPPILIAVFFFVVNIGTLQRVTESQTTGFDIKAFMMPTAILIGVTGVSRAGSLVLDIQDGYFDRLLLTPVRRLAILIGHMVADVVVACPSRCPSCCSGFALGVRFESGPLGLLVFVALAGLWSLAFAGFGYAIALKTGNPAAVNSSLPAVLPLPVHDLLVRAAEPAERMVEHHCRLEPGHLRARGAAVPGHGWVALGRPRHRAARGRRGRGDQHVAVLRGVARPHQARLELRQIPPRGQQYVGSRTSKGTWSTTNRSSDRKRDPCTSTRPHTARGRSCTKVVRSLAARLHDLAGRVAHPART